MKENIRTCVTYGRTHLILFTGLTRLGTGPKRLKPLSLPLTQCKYAGKKGPLFCFVNTTVQHGVNTPGFIQNTSQISWTPCKHAKISLSTVKTRWEK